MLQARITLKQLLYKVTTLSYRPTAIPGCRWRSLRHHDLQQRPHTELADTQQVPLNVMRKADALRPHATMKMESSVKLLGCPKEELTLDFTLPTGQSFRWRKVGESEYLGVISKRLVRLKQLDHDVEWQVLARGPQESEKSDLPTLQAYFNLHEPLAEMSTDWAQKDARFKLISPFFPGARILQQDPVECLFQFICSSNNHISRIHGMVERLCSKYGTPLQQIEGLKPADLDGALPSTDPMQFYSFPTIEQLSEATEEALRADGFGYRAKFITGTVKALLAKEGGGEKWLLNLRDADYKTASEALITLPGIGPKVAACICLFSLNKHEAIPVDTHVWQLATKYYTPSLKGKTLTPKVMIAVENAFIDKFGPMAGWAHNVLFISDLASSRQYLPENLRPAATPGKKRKIQTVVKEETVIKAEAEDADNAVGKGRSKRRKTPSKKLTEFDLELNEEPGDHETGAPPESPDGAVRMKRENEAEILGLEDMAAESDSLRHAQLEDVPEAAAKPAKQKKSRLKKDVLMPGGLTLKLKSRASRRKATKL